MKDRLAYGAPGPPDANSRRLIGIQYLRVIAALMVAYFHAAGQIPAYRSYFERDLLGDLDLSTGVDIFFVISGFIIMLVTDRASTPPAFAVRRIIRIVPMYWLLTTLLTLIEVKWPDLFRSTFVTPAFYVKSLLFIPYLNPGHAGGVYPILVPGWTLNLEVFFYLMFALTLYAPARLRLWLAGLVVMTLATAGIALRDHTLPPALRFYTDSRIVEFWIGMLIAHFYLRGALRMRGRWAAALALGGFAALLSGLPADLLGTQGPMRALLADALPAGAVVLGIVALEQGRWIPLHPMMGALGDASYSIYLTHIFTLGAWRFIWTRMGLERDGLGYASSFALTGMLLVLSAAWLVYRHIELPIQRALHERLRRFRPALHKPSPIHTIDIS
jgi:exopolysaccharide production protein ExoZ